jgi:hypothetical protein
MKKNPTGYTGLKLTRAECKTLAEMLNIARLTAAFLATMNLLTKSGVKTRRNPGTALHQTRQQADGASRNRHAPGPRVKGRGSFQEGETVRFRPLEAPNQNADPKKILKTRSPGPRLKALFKSI